MYRTALLCGISFFTLTALFRHQIVALFIGPEYAAYQIAVKGLPYFAFGFIFFRRQYDWNRLLSKYRTGTSGYRHHPATRDTIYAGGLPGASYITRCKRNMAGRPSGRSTHPSPDRQPLSARKAETEVLNLPKSALLLWRTFGLVRRPYDYLNLKIKHYLCRAKKRTDQLWKSLSRNSAEGITFQKRM